MERDTQINQHHPDLPFGWKLIVNEIDPFEKVEPDDTSEHEAIHTYVALETGTGVKKASREPGPGFSGITIMESPNEVAAIAPHAWGCSGTGWDVSIVRIMGKSQEAAAAKARRVIMGGLKKIRAIASLISIHGTITGQDALKAMHDVDNPDAEIKLVTPFGDEHKFVTKLRDVAGVKINSGLPEKANNVLSFMKYKNNYKPQPSLLSESPENEAA